LYLFTRYLGRVAGRADEGRYTVGLSLKLGRFRGKVHGLFEGRKSGSRYGQGRSDFVDPGRGLLRATWDFVKLISDILGGPYRARGIAPNYNLCVRHYLPI
jgi:hypothetical protein